MPGLTGLAATESDSDVPIPSSSVLPVTNFPPILTSDLLACRFSAWYPLFRRISPKATIISSLEERFIEYLESDRVFLPEGSGPMGISEMSDDDEESGNGSDSEEDESWQFKFEELDARIRQIIVKYDGAVFPKLNWTSPQDAAWMVPGPALKCQSPADVYLLLKSSDFISNDLDQAFAECVDHEPPPEKKDGLEEVTQRVGGLEVEDSDEEEEVLKNGRSTRRNERPYNFELVLKKWFDMPKSQEWRCFVRNKELIGISQRDNNYYEFLQLPEAQNNLRISIALFFENEIRSKFPCESFTFDIYFTRNNEKIFLIDFNPYSPRTDSLLFDWSTIHSLPALPNLPLPILRLITSSTMASQTMPNYSHNRYPKDVVDLSNGASIAEFAEKYRGALAKATLEEGSDSEEEKESVGR